MSLYLGVDVGTTAIKVVAIDPDGRIVAEAGAPYPLAQPQPGWVEQNPEDWWRVLCRCVREVVGQTRQPVRALSLSTQGDTMVPLDATGRPLAPARTWMDTRTLPQVQAMNELGPDYWLERTGGIPGCFAAATSLLWWRDNRPEIHNNASKFSLVPGFLHQRLTGDSALDAPNASRTLLYNIYTHQWDEDLLNWVGIDHDRLDQVAESGHPVGCLTEAAAAALGLSTKVQVVLGGHDQICAAIGCGVTRPGHLMLSTGTAWVVLAALEKPLTGTNTSLQSYCHAVPGSYAALGAFAGGNLLRWFRDTLWETEGEGAYDEITAAAQAAQDAGRPPLLFMPHFYGTFTPRPCPEARGAWVGLTLSHDRGDLALALLEGVARQARWVMDNLRQQGAPLDEVRMIGGGARSLFWAQLVANALETEVCLPQVREAASYGAALIAASAAEAIPAIVELSDFISIREKILPKNSRRNLHAQQARELFERLTPLWGGS